MTTTTEASQIGQISICSPFLPEYLTTQRELRIGAPDAYYELGVCRHCGASLGETDDDKVIPIGSFGFLPNVCCPSCSQAGKDRLDEEYRKASQTRYFSGNVPDEFIHWDESKGNVQALSRVLGKFSFTARRNLVLQGPSGTCKTRIMWELVKRVLEQVEGYSFLWLDSYDAATKGIPEEAHKAAFLFIDDLGNEPTSNKFETAMLRLIRNRCDWHRPFVLSTQLDAPLFAKRFFSGAAAAAIMRRMKERTDSVFTV
jgi:DNA replication protein DnaC